MLALACAQPSPASNPMQYRLAHSGTHWDVVGDDAVLDDLQPRYPEFFAIILDPSRTHEPNLLLLRQHLEQRPVDRRNFDALNAIAIAYFEINYRAEASRDGGLVYLGQSFRSAKLLAVPWRAYGEIDDSSLRDAILDFFEDAASGEKLGTLATSARLSSIVKSLEAKEGDPARRERIRRLAEQAHFEQIQP
jgi:hypothetical protein